MTNGLNNNENIILQEFPETNIVFFNEKNKSAQETINKLKDLGVLANNEGTYVRLVTNLNISDEDILALLKTLEKL
ncbi:MAG: hypothetical protein EOL97_03475 [Spirochaetia bacterium]|nr:hypothetical protein [Spirochaetia bacterium]